MESEIKTVSSYLVVGMKYQGHIAGVTKSQRWKALTPRVNEMSGITS